MLLIFGIAMIVMGWILIPTFGDVGPDGARRPGLARAPDLTP